MSGFSFRIRFRIPRDGLNISVVSQDYRLADHHTLLLKAREPAASIRDAEWLIVRSSTWKSRADAEQALGRTLDSLRVTLAAFGMSADLGDRAVQSQLFPLGLRMVERQVASSVVNDVHGAVVLEASGDEKFAMVGPVSARRLVQEDRWHEVFKTALASHRILSPRERSAFDLLAGAQSVSPNADARFILLFAAFETLLEGSPRSEAAQEHVNTLIEVTEKADIPSNERTSLLGTLRWLRQHSIRRSGRDLVRRQLAGRKYGDWTGEKLFRRCYDLRNNLIHGSMPLPTRQELEDCSAQFEMMIGHLIAGPLVQSLEPK